jgi:hypothetical protein
MSRKGPPRWRTPEAVRKLQGVHWTQPFVESERAIKQSLAALMVLGIDALVNRDAIECPSNQ